jgi:hypothetical protein
LKYKYHFCYSGIDKFYLGEKRLGLTKLFGDSFRIYLSLAKLLNCKVIHFPSGCLQEETKEHWSKYEDGNVCNNCGWGEVVCNDKKNIKAFNLLKKYCDLSIGLGCFDSNQFPLTHIKYKVLDFNIWNSDIIIPQEYKLPPTENLRILHGFVNENRTKEEKNIKGSPYIIDAVKKLQDEGYKVELLQLNHIQSRQMRYYQLQADIIVDQLIYGWWGSSGVECLGLGKPVICFLRPSFKKFFLEVFREYPDLPIIESDVKNIYPVIKRLITNQDSLIEIGNNSRKFAKAHFDLQKNTSSLSDLLLSL